MYKINKTYLFVVIAYAIMQLSSFVFMPAILWILTKIGIAPIPAYEFTVVFWIVFSFSAGLFAILYLLKKEISFAFNSRSLNWGKYIGWGILGMFLALFAQGIAVKIMEVIGLPLVSENTQDIIGLIEMSFLVIIATSIIGPILEEIVFRKILFGELMKKFGFLISSLVSSLVFAAVHNDFTHTLVYVAMGLVFAYLYKKTQSIITPIIAHMLMNTLVVIAQLFREEILELNEKLNTVQTILGGLL